MESNQEIPTDRVTGRVKWFNNKTGYGFITTTNGQKMGTDIFVHHSSIVLTGTEQYKYLVQGEYVEFNMIYSPGETHEYQSGDVTGMNGGKLMCETRHEFRQNQNEYSSSRNSSETQTPRSSSPKTPRGPPRTITPRQVARPQETPRGRGSGPRETPSEDTNTNEYKLVAKRPTRTPKETFGSTVRPPKPQRTNSTSSGV